MKLYDHVEMKRELDLRSPSRRIESATETDARVRRYQALHSHSRPLINTSLDTVSFRIESVSRAIVESGDQAHGTPLCHVCAESSHDRLQGI